MKYLLDSNTLIEAKNRYYNMTVCPAYWDWIVHSNDKNDVASIEMVAAEIKKGNDELATWGEMNSGLFLPESDAATQASFVKVLNTLTVEVPKMKAGAFDEFVSGADPWLIAKAMSTGATVVTHEVYNPAIVRKFTIPNICAKLSVPYMNTFQLLSQLDARFVLQAA